MSGIEYEINRLNSQIYYYQDILNRLNDILNDPNTIEMNRQQLIYREIESINNRIAPMIERRNYLQLYLQNYLQQNDRS